MNNKKERQPTEFSDVAAKIEQNLAKKLFKDTSVAWDQTEGQKTLQAQISDILFGTKAQEEMQKMLQRRLRRLEIDLRWAFLERFGFPMKLARGEFIRYQNKEHGVTIFSYEGHPFGVEKEKFIMDDSGKYPRSGPIYLFEKIKEDESIFNILQPRLNPERYFPKRYSVPGFWGLYGYNSLSSQ